MVLRVLVLTAICVLAVSGFAYAADVELLTVELPWAAVNRGYSAPPLEVRVTGKCPAGGVGYSVASGVLPAGIALSNAGHFSGVPTRKGTFYFRIRASDGCSWTARLFSLIVTDAPVLKVLPDVVKLVWRAGAEAPTGVLRVESTWPGLRYQIHATEDWILPTPAHGLMATGESSIAYDSIVLKVSPAERKPGHYTATVEVSAWQSDPVRSAVDLTVE